MARSGEVVSATRSAPAPRFGSGRRPRRGWECGCAQATRARPDWLWRRQPNQPTGDAKECEPTCGCAKSVDAINTCLITLKIASWAGRCPRVMTFRRVLKGTTSVCGLTTSSCSLCSQREQWLSDTPTGTRRLGGHLATLKRCSKGLRQNRSSEIAGSSRLPNPGGSPIRHSSGGSCAVCLAGIRCSALDRNRQPSEPSDFRRRSEALMPCYQ
jgi:hypothetical protein